MAASISPTPPPPLRYRPCKNDGLLSAEALRIIVEVKACSVALALALAYVLTASQHRLWSSSRLVKGFLFAVTQPVTRFLVGMFTMMLAMPFRNDLYLLWGILLLAGYEGVFTISGYGVSARRSDLVTHEFARGYNIVLLGLYVRYYSSGSQFRRPLWALWALMVAKFLERLVRFKLARGTHGDDNTSLVAHYMQHEHEQTPTEEANPTTMRGYRYLVVGDPAAPTTARAEDDIYDAPLVPAPGAVTVEQVWQCQGRVLDATDKDVCLSFALCRLLKRKFAGVSAAEGEKEKARRLVFDGLLGSGAERTFRVVRVELGFARDLFYTKYPILFSSGFPVVSAVLFGATLGVSLWIAGSAIRHYRAPQGSTSNVVHGKNVDLLITFAIVAMVAAMEICEFFMHLFSDWTKVMVLAEYVQNKSLQNSCLLYYILQIIYSGKLIDPIGSSMGQLTLLTNNNNKTCIPDPILQVLRCIKSYFLLTNDDGLRIKKGRTLRVPEAVKEVICRTLVQNRDALLGRRGDREALPRLQRAEALKERYKCPTRIHTIMVWHVATCKLEADCPMGKDAPKRDTEHFIAATTLAKYCAYLVFYKPKLLPLGSNSVRYMCKKLADEAKAPEAALPEGSVTRRGKRLAEELKQQVPDGNTAPWEALAEFWSELIVSLAPHGSIGAHQKELGKGGEFITHLWALLYHAGVDDKLLDLYWDAASAEAAARDDHISQNGINASVVSGGEIV